MLEYIQDLREILHNLQNRMQKAKQNIDGISQAMKVSKQQGIIEQGLTRSPGEGPGEKAPTEMLTESPKGSRNLLCEALDCTTMSRWSQGREVPGQGAEFNSVPFC